LGAFEGKVAYVLSKTGSTKEAKQMLEKAVERNPGDSSNVLNFLRHLLREGKVEEGELLLRQAADHGMAEASFAMGDFIVALHQGDLERADTVSACYSQEAPDLARSRVFLAEQLYAANRREEARLVAEELISDPIVSVGTLKILARVYIRSGRFLKFTRALRATARQKRAIERWEKWEADHRFVASPIR
jgi:Tfp pilus assembly protein PilF